MCLWGGEWRVCCADIGKVATESEVEKKGKERREETKEREKRQEGKGMRLIIVRK